MLGSLTERQCQQVLTAGVTGRIGCSAHGKMYIVPVTYVYHEGFLYLHSKEGTKIDMMRKNPEVCFQIDEIDSMSAWRSVQLWGKFEELKTTHEIKIAWELLRERFAPLETSTTVRPVHHDDVPIVEKERRAIYYRISIDAITGRYEKRS